MWCSTSQITVRRAGILLTRQRVNVAQVVLQLLMFKFTCSHLTYHIHIHGRATRRTSCLSPSVTDRDLLSELNNCSLNCTQVSARHLVQRDKTVYGTMRKPRYLTCDEGANNQVHQVIIHRAGIIGGAG